VLVPTTLPHLRTLGVSPRLLEARFAAECRIEQCDASCCRIGVRVDVGEREGIIAHARLVQDSMDPDQEREPARSVATTSGAWPRAPRPTSW